MNNTTIYDIFITQFTQTLAQISAGAVGAFFAVPLYKYYLNKSYQNNVVIDSNDFETESDAESDAESVLEETVENTGSDAESLDVHEIDVNSDIAVIN
jgi:hypothetical protein